MQAGPTMHGIEEFSIVRGDTLTNPAFLHNDELKTFNVILANPPYSIKAWEQKGFANDPFGRNLWGVPPKGCADYAFQQHIQKSLDGKNGRSITLWPHGILFRDSESEIRRNMIEQDLVECVIGLGPNLFYNSPMEACLLITKTNKEPHKRGKILFINAVNEVKQEKTMSFLEQKHIDKIFGAFQNFDSQENFSALISIEDVMTQKGNMAISLYVQPEKNDDNPILPFEEAFENWEDSGGKLLSSMRELFQILGN
jgi:type I restriction enzyme M protein